jgi:uncharacterized protein involved in response to NO
VLLVLMSAAAGCIHAAELGLASPLPAWAGLQLGLDVVLFIISVMSGRVIPLFTNNGVPGAAAGKKPLVEQAALGLILVLSASDAGGLSGTPLAVIAALAGIAHAVRWLLWRPWKARKVPLVWSCT